MHCDSESLATIGSTRHWADTVIPPIKLLLQSDQPGTEKTPWFLQQCCRTFLMTLRTDCYNGIDQTLNRHPDSSTNVVKHSSWHCESTAIKSAKHWTDTLIPPPMLFSIPHDIVNIYCYNGINQTLSRHPDSSTHVVHRVKHSSWHCESTATMGSRSSLGSFQFTHKNITDEKT